MSVILGSPWTFLFFTLQKTILAPLALELGRNEGQVRDPKRATDKRCLACVKEREAFQSFPLVRIRHVVGLQLGWWHSGKSRVNEKVAMPDINLYRG